MSAVLGIFFQAEIAKLFPAHNPTDPFLGTVHKVDKRGKDDKPFKIHYLDGDKEWVTLAELAEILVDPTLQERARALLESGVPVDDAPVPPAAPQPAAPNSRKRGSTDNRPSSAAGGPRKRTSAPQEAAGAGAGTDEGPSRRGPRVAHTPASAAAAAAAEHGAGRRALAKAAAAAAAAGGSAGQVSPEGSEPVDAAELHGLVKQVCQLAPANASKMQEGAMIMRLTSKGPGTSTLPYTSQGATFGSEAAFTVYGSSRSPSLTAAGAIDYRAETLDVLRRLELLLENCGAAHKKTLTRVRVYLRNIEEGLPGFTQAWNSWVEPNSAPVLTVLEGTGPFSTAGVVMEANAYTGP